MTLPTDTPDPAVIENMAATALKLFTVPSPEGVSLLWVAGELQQRYPGVRASFLLAVVDEVASRLDPTYQPPDDPAHAIAQLTAFAEYLRQREYPQ